MPKFEVPCTWRMYGSYHIEAENLREAINKAEKNLPLPSERDYVDDSLVIDEIDAVYEANNIPIPTLGRKQIRAELDKRTDPQLHILGCFDPETAAYSTDELIGILRDYYGETYALG